MKRHKPLVASVAAVSLSIGVSGCGAIGLITDIVAPSEPVEAVVCDDSVDPDCAPERDVIIIEDE